MQSYSFPSDYLHDRAGCVKGYGNQFKLTTRRGNSHIDFQPSPVLITAIPLELNRWYKSTLLGASYSLWWPQAGNFVSNCHEIHRVIPWPELQYLLGILIDIKSNWIVPDAFKININYVAWSSIYFFLWFSNWKYLRKEQYGSSPLLWRIKNLIYFRYIRSRKIFIEFRPLYGSTLMSASIDGNRGVAESGKGRDRERERERGEF